MFRKQALSYEYRNLLVVAIRKLSYERFDWLNDFLMQHLFAG